MSIWLSHLWSSHSEAICQIFGRPQPQRGGGSGRVPSYGGFPEGHHGAPLDHPFLDGIFQPAMGVPPFMEPPTRWHQKRSHWRCASRIRLGDPMHLAFGDGVYYHEIRWFKGWFCIGFTTLSHIPASLGTGHLPMGIQRTIYNDMYIIQPPGRIPIHDGGMTIPHSFCTIVWGLPVMIVMCFSTVSTAWPVQFHMIPTCNEDGEIRTTPRQDRTLIWAGVGPHGEDRKPYFRSMNYDNVWFNLPRNFRVIFFHCQAHSPISC